VIHQEHGKPQKELEEALVGHRLRITTGRGQKWAIIDSAHNFPMDDHKINLPTNGSKAEMEIARAIKKHTEARMKMEGLQVGHSNTTIKISGYRQQALKQKLARVLQETHSDFSYEGEDMKKHALEWKSKTTRLNVTLNFSSLKSYITV
jgi:hypothetical protein